MKKLAMVLFLFPTLCMGGGYIESTVVDGATTNAVAEANGKYNVSYSHGSAPYTYNIFYSACNKGVLIPYAYSYISLPLTVEIGGKTADITWSTASGNITKGDRFIVYSRRSIPGKCSVVGDSAREKPAAALTVTGVAGISELLTPGTIVLSDITYYVGNVFGDSESEALSILRQYHDKGTPTKLRPNGNGLLTVPYQCKLANGADNIDISMGEIALGTKKSKLVNYIINCNAEYAALKAMNFELYGKGNQEIFASPNRQMIKIQMNNGSVGTVDITPQLSGSNVNLSINATLDASSGMEGSSEGSVILRYGFD